MVYNNVQSLLNIDQDVKHFISSNAEISLSYSDFLEFEYNKDVEKFTYDDVESINKNKLFERIENKKVLICNFYLNEKCNLFIINNFIEEINSIMKKSNKFLMFSMSFTKKDVFKMVTFCQ